MARDIAIKFNHHYGNLFTPPEAQISETTGVLPGIDGRKMSKSYGNTIPIFSDEKLLKKTIMKIKTNSLEPGEPKDSKSCNVFSIYKAIASDQQVDDFQSLYREGIGWGDAKNHLFVTLKEFLAPFNSEYSKIIEDRRYVESVLLEGSKKALEFSTPLIEDVRKAVGIKGF